MFLFRGVECFCSSLMNIALNCSFFYLQIIRYILLLSFQIIVMNLCVMLCIYRLVLDPN